MKLTRHGDRQESQVPTANLGLVERRRIALATATVLAVASSGGAQATGLESGLGSAAAPAVERAWELAAAVRAGLEGDGLTSRVRGLLRAAGRSPAPDPRPPTAVDIAGLADLPVALRTPVAGLAASVREAIALLGALPPQDVRRGMRSFVRGVPRATPNPAMDRGKIAFTTVSRPGAAPVAASVLRAASAGPAALLMLAEALDRYLPALLAWEGTTATDVAENGCDLVDQVPLLCVGSEQATTFTEDVALLIDLGGSDTHLNSSGGAPFLPEGGPAFVPVSVSVDLGGDDRYLPHEVAIPGSESLVIGSGSGYMGGLGLLLDVAGDDVYQASTAPAAGESPAAAVIAQGAGVSGTGALLDLAGVDSYEIRGSDGSEDWVGLLGQGIGVSCAQAAVVEPTPLLPGAGCGIGGLIDAGSGDDAYRMEAGTVDSPLGAGVRSVAGQGFGNLATGVLFDDGGTDLLRATASSRALLDFYVRSPLGAVSAQGFGQSGVGLLLMGAGDTTYEIEVSGEGMTAASVDGQGVGMVAGLTGQGLGVLDDVGGNDRYDASASLAYARHLIVDDTCTVLDEETGETRPCTSAAALVAGSLPSVTASVKAQGGGWGESVGILHDRAGDDVYVARTEERIEAALEDRMSSPDAPPRFDVRSYPPASVYAQGVAVLFAHGALVDEAGTDSYTIRSTNAVSASATSEQATGVPVVTAKNEPRTYVAGQGAGDFGGITGALLDLGGSGDRFEAVITNPAETAPDPDGAFQPAAPWPYVQGAFGGVLLALGDDPLVLSHPSRPVCPASPGARGFGTWNDCALSGADPGHQLFDSTPIQTQHSLGRADATAGPDLRIAFLPESSASGVVGGRLAVAARLTDAAGKPLAGVTLHFDLQLGPGDFVPPIEENRFGNTWGGVWTVDAVTGPDGVARARVPLALEEWQMQYLSERPERVLATFDGAPGLRPVHVEHLFALLPSAG